MYRIGYSEDIHPIACERSLVLGGVKISSTNGLVAHSDGDIVSHVVAEALLGALALGDLGSHFSDKDKKYRDYKSLLFVDEIVKMIGEKGYEVVNIDLQIAIAKPNLQKFIPKMKTILAKSLRTQKERISIKAMSFNKVGPIGNGEAAKAAAIVLLKQKE